MLIQHVISFGDLRGNKKKSDKEILSEIKSAAKTIKSHEVFITSGDIKNLSQYTETAVELITNVLPVFFIGGDNLIHNHKYRELTLSKIFSDYMNKHRPNNMHGADINLNLKAECKSMTCKTEKLNISPNTQIGQIDKVYNKVNDKDLKYSASTEYSLVCGIFSGTSAIPMIVFFVSNSDFGLKIQPLLNNANTNLQKQSSNLTEKKRDSLTLKIGDFISCKSFAIIFYNDSADVEFKQEFKDLITQNKALVNMVAQIERNSKKK